MEDCCLASPGHNSVEAILFSTQVMKKEPLKSASPCLHEHGEDIANYKYKEIDLIEGWLVVKEEQGKPVEWKMRELEDCQNDLWQKQ